jgi:hypothetical protein
MAKPAANPCLSPALARPKQRKFFSFFCFLLDRRGAFQLAFSPIRGCDSPDLGSFVVQVMSIALYILKLSAPSWMHTYVFAINYRLHKVSILGFFVNFLVNSRITCTELASVSNPFSHDFLMKPAVQLGKATFHHFHSAFFIDTTTLP